MAAFCLVLLEFDFAERAEREEWCAREEWCERGECAEWDPTEPNNARCFASAWEICLLVLKIEVSIVSMSFDSSSQSSSEASVSLNLLTV